MKQMQINHKLSVWVRNGIPAWWLTKPMYSVRLATIRANRNR